MVVFPPPGPPLITILDVLINFIIIFRKIKFMISSQNSDEFYQRFLEKLKVSQSWPGMYMFKFIMPSDCNYIDELISIFNKFDINISRKYSSNRKFLSISINTKLDLPEEVIKIYKKTTHFKGLIRL